MRWKDEVNIVEFFTQYRIPVWLWFVMFCSILIFI
jgi:hypothetical protein